MTGAQVASSRADYSLQEKKSRAISDPASGKKINVIISPFIKYVDESLALR